MTVIGDSIALVELVEKTADTETVREGECSAGYIQLKFHISYDRAARLVEEMGSRSIVTPANHGGKREILVGETE